MTRKRASRGAAWVAVAGVLSAGTNSFDGTASTTLYDIDSGSDRLFAQGSAGGEPVSPNTGNLIAVGPLGVAPRTTRASISRRRRARRTPRRGHHLALGERIANMGSAAPDNRAS